jgi:hypothetical protein
MAAMARVVEVTTMVAATPTFLRRVTMAVMAAIPTEVILRKIAPRLGNLPQCCVLKGDVPHGFG